MKIYVLAACLVSSATAMASSPTFELNTLGNAHAYTCNAGIKHPGVSYLMDYMSYNVTHYELQNIGVVSRRVLKAGSQSYSNAVSVEKSFYAVLKNVNANLGSEFLGASYFVDVCYRGPSIAYANQDESQSIKTTFVAQSRLAFTGLGEHSNYIETAQPEVRTTIHCDLQGKGEQQFASDGVTTKNDIDFDAFNRGEAGKSDYAFSTGFQKMNTSAGNTLNEYIGKADAVNAPRFCIIRYEIKETAETVQRRFLNNYPTASIFLNIAEPSAL